MNNFYICNSQFWCVVQPKQNTLNRIVEISKRTRFSYIFTDKWIEKLNWVSSYVNTPQFWFHDKCRPNEWPSTQHCSNTADIFLHIYSCSHTCLLVACCLLRLLVIYYNKIFDFVNYLRWKEGEKSNKVKLNQVRKKP